MQGGAWGNEYRTTIVCVDEYQDSVLSGRLYHPYLPEGDSFHSLMEFCCAWPLPSSSPLC